MWRTRRQARGQVRWASGFKAAHGPYRVSGLDCGMSRDGNSMHVALVTKSFASSNNDYCLPPLIDFVRSISDHVTVDVYALNYPYERRAYSLFGARVFALGLGRLSRLTAKRSLTKSLSQEHKRHAYDLIHAVFADHPADLAAGLAQKLELPLITSFYAGEAVWIPQIAYGSLGRATRRGALTSVLARSAAVTAGSSTLSETVSHLFETPVRTLPFGYDPERFNAVGPQDDFGLGRHIVTAASIAPVKGLEGVLAALKCVARDTPRLLDGITWHVVGPDPRDRALRQALSQQIGALPIVLHEAKPHWEMPRFYRTADLALVGSWFESQCFAAIEPPACGVPVFGTSVGIMPQMVSPSWLCPPGDPPTMAELITRVLSAPQTWGAETKRQQDWLATHATLDFARDRFLELYKSVLKEACQT